MGVSLFSCRDSGRLVHNLGKSYLGIVMGSPDDQRECEGLSANLQRGIELTELVFSLRLAVLWQQNPACTKADVLHEICLANERAWQANQTWPTY